MLSLIILLVVVGTSIWVLMDASNLGVRRGALGGGFADMGVGGWFFVCLLLWIIGFPMYLATRPKYVAHRAGSAMSLPGQMGPDEPGAPPPGWYLDPDSGGGQRWWDGRAWGPAVPAPTPVTVTAQAGVCPNCGHSSTSHYGTGDGQHHCRDCEQPR
jgi:hypothetical protein